MILLIATPNPFLQTKFRYLKSLGLRSSSKIKKVNTEGEPNGIKMDMNKLVEFQKRGHTGRNCLSRFGKARDMIGITCIRCHKKGQFQDNCPLAKKACKISVKVESSGTSGSDSATAWRYKRSNI